jgi:hypothetical protein
MALFTDGKISTLEDLIAQDPSVLDVASIEGIDVTKKLDLAVQEIAGELGVFLQRIGTDSNPITVNQVVISPQIRLWHSYHTLTLIYRSAYHNQLNDRYQGRSREYGSLARWASNMVTKAGVGLVWRPLRQADPPLLSAVPGAGTQATYYVRCSWTDGLSEGAASELMSLSIETNYDLKVDSTGIPENASGWNVYAGLSPDDVRLHNLNPIAPGESYICRGAMATSSRTPSSGQEPDCIRVLPRVIRRG